MRLDHFLGAISVLLLAGSALFVSACGSGGETTVASREDIEGKWVLDSAYREGKYTATLENLFFAFGEDLLSTNLMGSTGHYTYAVSDGKIHQSGKSELWYDIENKTDSSMTLRTTIRNYDFIFLLKRDTAQFRPEEYLQ